MKLSDGRLRLAATDLANHLGCRHLTQLDRLVADGDLAAPEGQDPALALLRERGREHEQACLEQLRREGRRVVDLHDAADGDAAEQTLRALREGADVVAQAELSNEHWAARADLLLRVEAPSALGAWSYEVAGTKLALETRPRTLLELCLHSELLEALQEHAPESMHVVKPGVSFARESFRVADFQAYYRHVRRQLECFVASSGSTPTYPDPVPQCDTCRWAQHCERRRREDDNVSFVAGLQAHHVVELERQGIRTLEAFATRETPLSKRPERDSPDSYARLHAQARIQLEGRRRGEPVYELLPPTRERGLQRLPAPDPGDVFFDLEGDPFVDRGGLEYLHGFAFVEGAGLQYRSLFSADRAAEKQAFEAFVDFLTERMERHPAMHVYHFAPYEPAAVKRLMGRHATREREVDAMLRSGRFVDLHAVTRQTLRASVEHYSLKDLEPFFGFDRSLELRSAGAALRRVARALEFGSTSEISATDLDAVEQNNRDDCLAAAGLRDWLEGRRAELVAGGLSLPRPEPREGRSSDALGEREGRAQGVHGRLLGQLPDQREDWGPDASAVWLLAHQLDYFRREDKCVWWEYSRLHDLEHEDLLEERKAVSGLEFDGEVSGGTPRCPVHRYRFPTQEASVDPGDRLHEVGGEAIGKVHAVSHVDGRLDIRKRRLAASVHPAAVLVNERVQPEPLDESLLELGNWVVSNGIDAPGAYRAARDLLLKRAPRRTGGATGALRRPDESAREAAVRVALELDHGVLPIQAPPGSGKTTAAARIIAELARAGKRVGVTAVSHKVIRHLLRKSLEEARSLQVPLEAVHKLGKPMAGGRDGIGEVRENDRALAALDEGRLVGGTGWLWAREDAAQSLDYLVVDEAGQMSLAHVLAASRAARNLILLGDPQQLAQPRRGAHSEGAEVAALVHALDGHETMPPERGLFLDVSWRLHPEICAFSSELYYEGQLGSLRGLRRQSLTGEVPFAGSGLFYVPVEHAGNRNRSLEEVLAVTQIVDGLLGSGVRWTDDSGSEHPLTPDDVMIVAPYNAQVAAISERLPDLEVGTVDKFQGKEAPVVIYSMASSSAEEAPRGMSFLYDPSRVNVATSRARCACILVASPRIFDPECRTVEQMRWANGLCRYHELAAEVTGFARAGADNATAA